MPTTSVIVTCKNRLHHLQQTLPWLLRQSDAEIIVVDYGCAQGTAQWISGNHPGVRVVRVTDDPVCSLARARNIGAAQAEGRMLLFSDADMIIRADMGVWIARNVLENCFYQATIPMHPSMCGTVVCARHDFERTQGYDEAYRGWGWEDSDLYQRFMLAGLRRAPFPIDFLLPIEHDDSERQIGADRGGMPTKEQAMRCGELYTTIKHDLMRMTGLVPEINVRLRIMSEVRDGIAELYASTDPQLQKTINFSWANIRIQPPLTLTQQLIYTLARSLPA